MSNRVIVLFPRHRGDRRVADLRRRILGLPGLNAGW